MTERMSAAAFLAAKARGGMPAREPAAEQRPASARWSIYVPGKAVGKGRPRFVRKTGHAYTPHATEAYERSLRLTMMANWDDPPLTEPVAIGLVVYGEMPKSWSKARKAESTFKPAACKPDIDNVLKIVADAGNGVLWVDDKQIAYITAQRLWSVEPGIQVMVEILR